MTARSDRSDRRWAELARELEFTQLSELRRQAEGWRSGLTGLAGLLAVLAVVKGPDTVANAPEPIGTVALTLVGAAFAALVWGVLLAARAAHGRPGEKILLAGQALRRWTESEAVRIARALRRATVACVTGVLFAAGSLVLLWSTAEAASTHLVKVVTADAAEICGELGGSGRAGVIVRTGKGDVRKRHVVPLDRVVSLTPVPSC
ncbi:hypothetical protein J7E96_16710 [Streptomyces sp. ISL-96]|uniref:hypothetical protein n=1 Tax=Streptomyces sp. ISL-96 TaxID=2819191 RepID=UPI001BEC0076|nr:hypothetical protein [Streptomyces sp. ISL-96]MBT2490129.1 hypothetical protein [Streptomyces sp. ISL-96]